MAAALSNQSQLNWTWLFGYCQLCALYIFSSCVWTHFAMCKSIYLPVNNFKIAHSTVCIDKGLWCRVYACSQHLRHVTLHALLMVEAEIIKAIPVMRTVWFEICPPEGRTYEAEPVSLISFSWLDVFSSYTEVNEGNFSFQNSQHLCSLAYMFPVLVYKSAMVTQAALKHLFPKTLYNHTVSKQ